MAKIPTPTDQWGAPLPEKKTTRVALWRYRMVLAAALMSTSVMFLESMVIWLMILFPGIRCDISYFPQ